MVSETTTSSNPVNLHHSQSFASSFWSPDYLSGISVLFDKLEQGVAENTQVINFITARISLESAYASNLQTSTIETATSRTAAGGFNRDEGASLKQGFESFLEESKNQAVQHAHIAANLERLVRGPFSQYAAAHKTRISTARWTLVNITKEYQKGMAKVAKAQQTYFSKARQLEDFTDPTITSRIATPSSPLRHTLTASEQVAESKPQSIELAGIQYSPEKLATLLSSMVYSVPQETMRLAILGSYDHVSVGEDIVLWVRQYINLKSLGEAEKFGQGLIDNGFLRLVGSVGSRFSGSTNSKYQWLPKALNFSAESANEPKHSITGATTPPVKGHRSSPSMSKLIRVGGYISGFLPHGDEAAQEQDPSIVLGGGRESHINKLQREIADTDQQYKDLVYALDTQRCTMEQAISETLTFMQQCERDRVKAVKTVLRDFASSISKTVETLSESVSRMALHQEFVDPLKDLDYLIERYKTGNYAPKPVVYDNFFNSTKIQSFGVDIKHSAEIVESCIEYLTSPQTLSNEDDKDETLRVNEDDLSKKDDSDQHSESSDSSDKTAVASPSPTELVLDAKYKGLSENSKTILASLWASQQSPLPEIQALRSKINTGQDFDAFEVFSGVPLQVVISTLKEFLLELPDSIVTSTVYDIIKTTYAKNNGLTATDGETESKAKTTSQRVERLVGLIAHLPRVNLRCLQTLLVHFAEICGLPESEQTAKEDNEEDNSDVPSEVQELAKRIAPYILRPRTTTALTMTDKHPILFVQDLIIHRIKIFDEVEGRLNAASVAKSRTNSAGAEGNRRRSQIEARNRAIAQMAGTSSNGSSGGGTPRSPSPVTMGSAKLLPLTLSPVSRLSEAPAIGAKR